MCCNTPPNGGEIDNLQIEMDDVDTLQQVIFQNIFLYIQIFYHPAIFIHETYFFQINCIPSPEVPTILSESCSSVANCDESMTSEIAAAVRSLKTNLILSIAVVIVFFFMAFYLGTLTVLIFSTMKGLVPILTTIANFGKVQFVLKQYWNSIQGNNLCCLNE